MPKMNNNRKFPNATRQPCHKDAERKLQAEVRQSVYDELSLERKLALLPAEPAAKKQRAKLLARLEKQNTKVQVKEEAPKPDAQEKKMLKKFMKGQS